MRTRGPTARPTGPYSRQGGSDHRDCEERADHDEDELSHGGHMMIFRTPHCTGKECRHNFECEDGYDQHIDGVLFTNFGQEGEKDCFVSRQTGCPFCALYAS